MRLPGGRVIPEFSRVPGSLLPAEVRFLHVAARAVVQLLISS
jgi:hypothetical protein